MEEQNNETQAEIVEVTTAVPHKRRGARPGCIKPLGSGRRAKSWAAAREIATELGIEPYAILLRVINDGHISSIKTVNGKHVRVDVEVPMAERLDLLRTACRHLYPTLSAASVSTQSEIEVRQQPRIDMTKLLSSPEMIDAAQTLAFGLAKLDKPAAQIPGPATTHTIDVDTAVASDLENLPSWHRRQE